MSKFKKTIKAKYKTKKAQKDLPFHSGTLANEGSADKKLSDAIKELAEQSLKNPKKIPSEPAISVAVMLATYAWNNAIGVKISKHQYHMMLKQIDWDDVEPWKEFKSSDTEQITAELTRYKLDHFPNDFRRIIAGEMTPEGNLRIHWTSPDNLVPASFGTAQSTQNSSAQRACGPIAKKLIKKMKKYSRSKVVDFNMVMTGGNNARELQKTVASQENLAHLHPAHAMYVYAQNQTSIMVEQLTMLKEMDCFAKLINDAEEEYMPIGPPMSPLTTSFFTCWAFFDACFGKANETLGTTTMAVGSTFGMHKELIRLIGLLQDSKMAVYAHEGFIENKIILRELVTNKVKKTICPSGYLGQKGELWYARVLPPPIPLLEEHVVFTTPYLLIEPEEQEWIAYFQRTLGSTPKENPIAAYENHMKFGPKLNYWSDFVSEAYANHRNDVIFLKGLPDIPKSRPNSKINSR